MVNFILPNHWLCLNGYIECSGFSVAPALGGWKTAHQHGWILVLCTIMLIFCQSGSSTYFHPWRTYRLIQSFTSFCLNQIQYHHNSTLVMGEVGCLVGWTALLVGYLRGSVVCGLTGIRNGQYDRIMRSWSSKPQSVFAPVLDSAAYCYVLLPRLPCYSSHRHSYHTR